MRLSGLANLPVRVRSGLAKSARWTLYPWTSYWRGTHEPELQKFMADLGDMNGWCCWDLGAHYGIYSLGLAMKTGSSGQVVAFEPNPVSYARLVRHIAMNNMPWLKPMQAAVSDRTGAAELYTYGQIESTTTHLAYEGETRVDSCRPVEVQVACLDEMVNRGEIRLPDLIKIDVEGHGHKALAGATEAIKSKNPIIIAALHGKDETEGIRSILKQLGYEERSFPWCPVVDNTGDVFFLPRSRVFRSNGRSGPLLD